MSTFAEKECKTCRRSFAPKGPRQVYCGRSDCGPEAEHKPRAKAEEKAEETPAVGVAFLDVVDAFALDYFLGNAVRFVLEKDDGDELENLRIARTYLEQKIERLEREAVE